MVISRRDFCKLSAAAAAFGSMSGLAWSATDRATTELCRKLAADPLRPQYHLLPAHNWMNDPNGPIYFGGRYHMFHQYNPQSAVWGNMNWAHATSPDMIHWQHEPIALSPTPGGPDRDGVFSGSAVVDNGKVTMIYTGVAPPASDAEATLRDGAHAWREMQCLAVAEDESLRTWKKLPEPVIAAPPPGMAVTGFRDPYVWRQGDQWMLILGSGIRGKGGAILLYSSPDLRHWTYLHPLIEGTAERTNAVNPVDSGEMWECPDFFPLGRKHVLLISTMGKVRWKVGNYANQRFIPQTEGIVDWGSYYAAKTMLDKNGHRILWGWIPETRSDAEMLAAGWSGAMALPRRLFLGPKGQLQFEVSQEAQQLGTAHTSAYLALHGKPSQIPEETRIKSVFESLRIHDLAAELCMLIEPTGDEFTLHIQGDDGRPFAAINWLGKAANSELQVNGVTAQIPTGEWPMVYLCVFLDGSILEVFVNESTALTARIYQAPIGPLRLKLEGAELRGYDVWQMQPISKDRLTGSMCFESAS